MRSAARTRKFKLVAEGAETAERLALLQRLGCDLGQGFHFARPLDVDAVEHRLTHSRAAVA